MRSHFRQLEQSLQQSGFPKLTVPLRRQGQDTDSRRQTCNAYFAAT